MGHAGHGLATGQRADVIVIAVDHQRRYRNLLGPAHDRVGIKNGSDARQQHLRGRLAGPSNAVLALLGGVRLGEALREEELGEVLIVVAPVPRVETLPTLRFIGVRLEEACCCRDPFGMARVDDKRRCDQDRAQHAAGVLGGQLQRLATTLRQAHQHHAVRRRRLQHRQCLVDHRIHTVRQRVQCSIGPAVARPIERHHAEVAREVRNLQLPEPAVHDGPGRQQQHRGLAITEHLVAHPDSAAGHEPLEIRSACSHCRHL